MKPDNAHVLRTTLRATATGICKLPDVASDCMGEYECEISWNSDTSSSSPAVHSIFAKYLSSDGGLQTEIVGKIDSFAEELQQL